jgi:biopolymer transport protein ExbD
MAWQLRHEGSPRVIKNLSLPQIADGLRDATWEATDEVLGPGEERWQAIENHPQLAELAEELEAPPPPRHPDATHLDMNALIDVCLVLLIFFILTTSYANMVQKVVPVPVSRAEGTKARMVRAEDVKARMIRLHASLDKTGKPVIRVENQTVNVLGADDKIDLDKLQDAFKPYTRGEDRKTEVIMEARDVTWETVIQIQDAARAAGVQTIHHLMRK